MERKKNLETCLVIVTGLLVIFLIKDWESLLIAAVIIGLAGIFLNNLASWITWLWSEIGLLIGKVVPKIILTIVFFLFLFPVSILFRMFSINHRSVKERSMSSMWTIREHTFSHKDLIKPF